MENLSSAHRRACQMELDHGYKHRGGVSADQNVLISNPDNSIYKEIKI